MALRLLPREDAFFELFNHAAENILHAARLLADLLGDGGDIERQAAAIKAVEEKGDEITHAIINRLNRTFVVPLDREDILALAKHLDDVVDGIEASAARLAMYRIVRSTAAATELARIVVGECEAITEAIGDLRHPQRLDGPVREIHRLENLADHVQRDAIAALFRTPGDPIDIMKWKEIYERLEDASDQCEHVAHLLEGIRSKSI